MVTPANAKAQGSVSISRTLLLSIVTVFLLATVILAALLF